MNRTLKKMTQLFDIFLDKTKINFYLIQGCYGREILVPLEAVR